VTICLAGTKWGHYLGLQLRAVYRGRLLVCGRDAKRTRHIARKLDADGMVLGWENGVAQRDVTAVLLALPPEFHVPAACRALASGKHVFVEKPLAPDLEGAAAMIDAARRARRVLFVGENVGYRPAIRIARERLAEIGEPRLFLASTLHHQTEQRHGILLDSTVHYIRAVRCLYGEPDRVFATQAHGPSGDNITLLLSSPEGWRATVWQSWQASAGRVPDIIMTGTDGALKLWPENSELHLFPNRPTALTRLVSSLRPWWVRELFRSLETQRVRIPLPQHDRMGYQAEIREFLQSIEEGTPTVESALSGRRDLEIALAGQLSLSTGSPVDCAPGVWTPA
jgi:predicted dehydrogenase